MNWASSEIATILTFLLPGFIAAAVYYSFTPYVKPSEFERIVQALIFTAIAQSIVFVLKQTIFGIGGTWKSFGNWSQPGELAISVVIAVFVGLIAVRVVNGDHIHKLFRRLNLTLETSFASEWHHSFALRPDCYVVLHLVGERRIYGWPNEWPSIPGQGHFLLSEAEWLVDGRRRPLRGVSAILIRASDVEMVEFLPVNPPKPEVSEND